MFDLYYSVCYFVSLLILIGQRDVCADMDLSKLFGKNVNSEEAWGKLFELENCPKPQPLANTIIMVNESLSAGAKFMDNPNVTSRFECEFECCYKQKEGCNIAVYTDKQKHCYLFDCGKPSKCRFDQHDGYTISLILENVVPEKGSTTVESSAPATTKGPSTTEAPPKELHLLDGCRPDIDRCVTANTECSNTGFCMCKSGYHPKNGVCRQDCLHGLQFECTNGDAKYAQPDCIAVYDVCDGSPQCPDGSDERDCEKDVALSSLGGLGTLKAKIEEYMKSHASEADGAKVVTTTVKATPAPQDIVAVVASTTSPDDKHEEQLTGLKTLSKANQTISKTVADISEEKPTNQSSSSQNEAVLEHEEPVADVSSRSAIIALSLSLTLTCLLMIYVGCRYRNMKTRITRRGKPLRGSEVDYLIDGMYM